MRPIEYYNSIMISITMPNKSVFTVITEQRYGGDDNVKVYRNRSDAEYYANILTGFDATILETPNVVDNIVYIVVTENYYGSFDTSDAQTFSHYDDAIKYVNIIDSKTDIDTTILQRDVM